MFHHLKHHLSSQSRISSLSDYSSSSSSGLPAFVPLYQRPFSASWLKLSFKNFHQIIPVSVQNLMVPSSNVQEEMQTHQWSENVSLPGACLVLRHSLCHTCSAHKDANGLNLGLTTSILAWGNALSSTRTHCSVVWLDLHGICVSAQISRPQRRLSRPRCLKQPSHHPPLSSVPLIGLIFVITLNTYRGLLFIHLLFIYGLFHSNIRSLRLLTLLLSFIVAKLWPGMWHILGNSCRVNGSFIGNNTKLLTVQVIYLLVRRGG